MGSIFRDNRFRAADIAVFEQKLFFEGQRRRQYQVRYYSLVLLASIIASYGILNNSPASVIGAMIIAPLMTPMMATAAALVMGDTDRDIRGLTLVASGAALSVGIAWLIGFFHSSMNIISVVANDQIASRISPRSTDLVIALASGAAGALAISREDIADSLPGVAIAISLVPPLCVGGICLSVGEWQAAWGAILLFITNFLSILLAGGGVFLLLGLRQAIGSARSARRHAFPSVIAGIVLVSIPLVATSSRMAQQAVTEFRTVGVTKEWLTGTGYQIIKVSVRRAGVVEITVGGQGLVPSSGSLARELRRRLSRPMTIDLKIVPIHMETIAVDLGELE